MEQELLKQKEVLKQRVAYGDITTAASELGLKNRQTLSIWLNTDANWPRKNAMYLKALKKVVGKRERELKQAMRA